MHHPTKGKANRGLMRNPPEEDPEFQIAPMIDILLVLLVFFMSISSTEVLASNKTITLPVAKDGKQPGKNPGQVIVNVSWSTLNNLGSIEVNNRVFPSAADMAPMLHDAIMKTPQTRVLIRADRGVRWEFMRQILKACGEAGISNVTFSVVDKELPNR
jgi:biopolymer transport protein ExbD